MNTIDSYGIMLCDFQGQLFEKSKTFSNSSSAMVIKRFMNSQVAKRFDDKSVMFEATPVECLLNEVEREYSKKEYGKDKYSNEELYWMGYIYCYWSYISGLSSKQIYNIIGANELRVLYLPYHTMDPKAAIERIMEAKNAYTNYDLRQQATIMKMIRNKKIR